VIARWQLPAIGVTPSMLKARVGAGILIRLHRGVYAVGHRQLRSEGHWLAAVLAVGRGAALSHCEAAALHGLRQSSRGRVDVTTASRGRADQPGIQLHRTTTLDAEEITTVDGIRVTTVARTLVDLATVVREDQIAKALREAEHLRVVDIRDIHAAMHRTRHRPFLGHAVLEAVLAEHRRRGTQLTRSVLEDRFIALCKANDLTQSGWDVLRFTHDDVVRRPAATAARIAAFLAGA
jgi:very-short-patch-repair endonuclease